MELPNEACGFLFGDKDEEKYDVKMLWVMENVQPSPAYFKMDDQAIFDAYGAARDFGHSIIGTIHSHPYWPAIPSSTDRLNMLNNPGLWIIESLNERQTRAYAFDGDIIEDNIREVPLVRTEIC